MPARPETPEQERNARLRRVDWRFLLPSPHPHRALCRGAGGLADAVARIADEVIAEGAGRRRVHDLLRGRIGSPICAIARCSSAPQSAERGPAAWLREGWTEWGLGSVPDRLSTLLVTGGPRSVSKVVLLAFEEPSPVPV